MSFMGFDSDQLFGTRIQEYCLWQRQDGLRSHIYPVPRKVFSTQNERTII